MNKADHPWVGVDNLIADDKGRILLMKRSDNSKSYPGYWGLVAGFVDWGETLEEALKREAMEEAGIEVEIIKFTGKFYDTPGRHPTKTVISLPFRTKIVSGTPKANQPEECSDVKWFTPKEVRVMELAYDHKQMLQEEGLI